ncbi:unnamed protein product [Rotaria socialis]|uniref:Uncharacterized protein n=1 Tax=Rotaria socialis TaxID=392032 RepID=A0A820SJK8_9BILA|nr:unnamed protein product [Rotaria socialis]CAF4451527.1 unnamed protein product [Rotaria socialis]
MIINSNINNNRNSQTRTIITHNNIIKDTSIRVSKPALDYASEYHHQLIRIAYDPKLKDQREGSKFIQAFINYTKIDFYNQNISVELLDKKKEYDALFISRKISIFEQLYDVDEFLPLPKLLICSKYNQPGHVKNYCKSANFNICRRCGNDRSNNDNHKECKINCHHCKGDHISTDYKCSFIQEYRRRLIIELQKHPDFLSPDIQLFVPSEYREQGDRTKIIFNKSAQNCQQRFDQQLIYDRNYFNVWSQISSHSSNTNMESLIMNIQQTLKDKIKAINNELNQ